MTDIAALLALHASLPEPRQPAWSLGVGKDAAKRAHDERIEAILPLLEALPHVGAFRILDVECAQGYFTLAIAHALAARGCPVEVVGLDRCEENVEFCEALAAHHGISASFVCAALDTAFMDRQEHPGWDAALVLGGSMTAADAGEEETVAAASLLRAHSNVTFCETWKGRPPDAASRTLADQLLASHAFFRNLASFQFPGGVARDLYACSDLLAWVGERWFSFDRVTDRSHAGVPDSFSGQRRFFLGRETVVKRFQGDGRHGVFNRAELAAEAEALQALHGEPGRYPSVLAQADDGDVVWLARESLPGELLSERMASAGGIDRDAVARGLLEELAHLESRGFHHTDLRCWNVLVDGDAVRLIDFGALVRTPSPLQRLTLCAVLLEIASGQAGHEQPFYVSVQPVEAYPPAWQPLLRYLLGTPQSAFRYEEAVRILVSASGAAPKRNAMAGTGMNFDDELLSSATREHCEAFRRLREHDEAMERSLASAERAHAAELAEIDSLRARMRELEQARQVAEREHVKHAASLSAAMDKSQAYATSLETRLAREAADVRTEREAMEAARRAATEYADSLKRSLDASREYADSLRDSLGQSQAYANSLETRIQRESDDANAAREALKQELDAAQSEATRLRHELDEIRTKHVRMQRRFRLLKFLWPHEPKDPE